jgi:early secretory antigenic target protein ESAT-6
MASGYGTSTEEMAKAGRHVLGVNEEVQSELNALRTSLGPLAGAWRGEASTAFNGLMARWDADARSLSQALNAIGTAIQGSAQAYQQQEQEQASSLSAIQSALG